MGALKLDPRIRKWALPGSIVLGAAALLVAAALIWAVINKPVIESINPAIGEKGDVLSLQGRHFGDIQGDSGISIGGVKPTASSFIGWSDTLIRVRIPETADSGLVYVRSPRGRSNSLLFTNREQVPVLFQGSASGSSPSIASLSISSGAVGATVSILGLNFGQNQEESQVLFTAARDANSQIYQGNDAHEYLGIPQNDPSYELWSDKEIRVIVPDGAVSGTVAVKTARGSSNTIYFEVTSSPGTKVYKNKRTYVIRYSVEISHFKSSGSSSLYLWVPRPLECATQRAVKAVQSSEKPTVENFHGLMLYHFKDTKDGQSLKALHDFILTSYELETQPKLDSIKPVQASSPIRAAFTAEEAEIPAANPEAVKAAADIAGKEKNPWKQAKLVYDWIETNVSIKADKNKGNALSALKERTGDAYSASLLFVSLCRSLGVPCAPVSGVWMDERQATHPHWWAEFFVDGLGWIPVDPAFGADAPGALDGTPRPKEGVDRKAYYFGNIDNDRIVFSRGFAQLTPQAPNSKLKPHGRFYSLQSITEEASASIESYTSFWSDVEITGVY